MPNQTDCQHIANKENTSIEGEFYSGKDMFDLEKERIKSADKRTEIARIAIEANDAADKRDLTDAVKEIKQDISVLSLKITGLYLFMAAIAGGVAKLVLMP
jgi:hypothetical protein